MITLALIFFLILFIVIVLIPADNTKPDPNKSKFDQAMEAIESKANDEVSTLKEFGKIEVLQIINEYKILRMKGMLQFPVSYIFSLLRLYRLSLSDVGLTKHEVHSWWMTEWFSSAIKHYTELRRIRRHPILKYFAFLQGILLKHDLKYIGISPREFIRIYRVYNSIYGTSKQ